MRDAAITAKRKLCICIFLISIAVLLPIGSDHNVKAKEDKSLQETKSFQEAKSFQEKENPAEEIVFLLDLSHSMNKTDPGYVMADFVHELLSAFPTGYQFGLVTYNSNIETVLPMGTAKEEITAALHSITYQEYSNPGAGLEQAVGLFTESNSSKRIIMISDGEVSMKTKEATDQAGILLQEAVKQIQRKGTGVDVIFLGDQLAEESFLLELKETAPGRVYNLADADQLAVFAETYLIQEWGLNHITIGKISGQEANLKIALPDRYMERAKILLLGTQEGASANIAAKADEIIIDSGQGYTIITLEDPSEQEIQIQMQAKSDMQVNAYLSAEYSAALHVESEAWDEEIGSQIWIEILSHSGGSLLNGHLQDAGDIQLWLNHKVYPFAITDHRISIQYHPEESGDITLQVKLPDTYGYYYGDLTAAVRVEVPIPEPEPEIDWFLWGTVFLAGLCLIITLIWLTRRKRADGFTQVPPEVPGSEKNNTSKNEFSGKLSVYILSSRDGIDYPPASINLFRIGGRKSITLQWILDTCELPVNVRDADKILFKPGNAKSLIIKNAGRATALKGKSLTGPDVLLKSHEYSIYFHEKVTFLFEDTKAEGSTEIEIHYKDLKTNER